MDSKPAPQPALGIDEQRDDEDDAVIQARALRARAEVLAVPTVTRRAHDGDDGSPSIALQQQALHDAFGVETNAALSASTAAATRGPSTQSSAPPPRAHCRPQLVALAEVDQSMSASASTTTVVRRWEGVRTR